MNEASFKSAAESNWQEFVCTGCKLLREALQEKVEGEMVELCTKQTSLR